jgi:hypothetical protein
MLRQIRLGALLFALPFLTSACLNTHQGFKAPADRAEVVKPIKEEEVELPNAWRRVSVGFKPKVKFAGFIRTNRVRNDDDEIEKTFYVFDSELNKQGFFFESGLAYRIDKTGHYKRVGIFDLDACVARILKTPGPINYYKMTPPEGSDTPFFDELNPPKTPPKNKADDS